MRAILATMILASTCVTLTSSPSDARSRHYSRRAPDGNVIALRKETEQLRRDVASLRDIAREFKAVREQIRGPVIDRLPVIAVADTAIRSVDMPVPDVSMFSEQPRAPIVLASLGPSSSVPPNEPKLIDRLSRVYPCDCTQRGQFRDQRRTHRHAGLDLGGELGSPILASFSGVVMPAPGGDRGYGPIVRVIKGDDGIVYRFAHMNSVRVKIGQRVETGEQIGTLGKVGRNGFPHLHFEMIPWNEYRHRPYGVHSLDPNSIAGGHRGHRMTAGLAMPVAANVQLASLEPSAVVDRTRIKRRHVYKNKYKHRGVRRYAAR